MTNRQLTFWQLITDAAGRAPCQVVVADDYGRSLTTAQLRDVAETVAAGLRVQPGSVVSWQLPTTIEGIVVFAALARAGAVQNPILPMLRERDVGLITRGVGTELFITVETWRGFDHAAMARDLGLNVVSIDLESRVGSDLRLPMAEPAELSTPPRSSTACRWLYFSSGTTGEPK